MKVKKLLKMLKEYDCSIVLTKFTNYKYEEDYDAMLVQHGEHISGLDDEIWGQCLGDTTHKKMRKKFFCPQDEENYEDNTYENRVGVCIGEQRYTIHGE